jgi:4-diphosphocytidyl-2-C-methyl-D-erythritol kinase
VFAALGLKAGQGIKRGGSQRPLPRDRETLIRFLAAGRNDMEPAAIALQPVIGRVLKALRGQDGCELARMSGSGATCFGLFASSRAAAAAARSLSAEHPRWWVMPTALG